MRTRFRFFAALTALLAVSAAFADGVCASTCAPMDGGPAPGLVSVAMDEMDMGDAPMPPMEHSDAPDSSRCPFPALGGATCVLATLPAAALRLDPQAPSAYFPQALPAPMMGRLAITSLFRPPQS